MDGYIMKEPNETMGLHKNTRMNNDSSEKLSQYDGNNQIYNYNMGYYNTNHREHYIESMKEPGLYHHSQTAVEGAHIDEDSQLKNGGMGNIMTNDKGKSSKQYILCDDYIFMPPYTGYGKTRIGDNVDVFSNMMIGERTRTRRSCDGINGMEINRFIPLVPCLEQNIQNTEHIIPKYWVRGGQDTRSIIRNIDYMKECGIKK